jgi:hypothetical protein
VGIPNSSLLFLLPVFQMLAASRALRVASKRKMELERNQNSHMVWSKSKNDSIGNIEAKF